MHNLWVIMTKNRNESLIEVIAFLSVLGFMLSVTIVLAQNEYLVTDKDYLISLCKKIESERKIENKVGPWYDLDNMDVKIYTENNYVVVYFLPKRVPSIIRQGGDVGYYFVKEESGGYRFVKALLGQ